jgi:site-specific recombinase XerD
MPGMPVTILTPEAIVAYQQWCTGRGRSHNTVRAYGSDLREFLKSAEGTVTKEEYEELAQAWLNLTRQLVAPSTTARRLTSLKSFAKWAKWGSVLEEYIAPKPGKTVPHPIPEGVDGLFRMIEHAKNVQQEALVALGGLVGLRVGESLSFACQNLDLESMMATIRGKGDKTRTVPMSEQAWNHIAPAYAMAATRDGQHLITYKDRFARQVITNLGARAGLRRAVRSHDLRATFATAAYDKTGDIRVVQELLGHNSTSTPEVYTGVRIETLREAVNF